MRTFTLHLIAFAGFSSAQCVTVHSDRITAGDMAGVVPQMQPLGPATPIAFTPLPGTRRTLPGRETRALLQRYGITVNPAEAIPSVCIERLVAPIDRDSLQKALLNVVDLPDAKLELIDFSNQPVPQGRFEFRIAGLCKPPAAAPDSPVIWRGKLVYDGERSMAVWARVRITVKRTVYLASEDISASTVIRPDQVTSRVVQAFPFSAVIDNVDAIVGKSARRRIAAGETLGASLLDRPMEVLKGNQVHVRVIDGLASLSFDGAAESSGKIGDTILVHNPASGRNFHAVIESRGQVIVRSGADE